MTTLNSTVSSRPDPPTTRWHAVRGQCPMCMETAIFTRVGPDGNTEFQCPVCDHSWEWVVDTLTPIGNGGGK